MTRAAGAPAPGLYPDGVEARLRGWDGHSWTAEVAADPDMPAAPAHLNPGLAFIRHAWFVVGITGYALGLVISYAAVITNLTWVAIPSVVGTAAFALAFVLYAWQRLDLGQAIGVAELTFWGVVSGAVALVFAHELEHLWREAVNTQNESPLDIMSGGPVEATGKLLVPVLLYAFGRYRDPRAGFAIVLVSGAVFGIYEGFAVVSLNAPPNPPGYAWSPVFVAASDPLLELLHPILSGFVAAVVWFFAWHRKRLWTLAGVGAWLLSVLIHSLNDLGDLLSLSINLVAGPILVVAYLALFRPAARQLAPPTVVMSNQPEWRPQLDRSRALTE